MRTQIIRDTLAFLLILGGASAAQGQTAAEPPNPLTQIKALKCSFPAATSAVWKEGAPQPQTKTQDMRFEITSFSRPHDLLTKLGGPVGRKVQQRATRRYLEGMRTFITD